MKASLDTNVLIHLYSAGEQEILFRRFTDGLYMYEQIRRVELARHGKAVLGQIDRDIANGKIRLISQEWLNEKAVLNVFLQRVNLNKNLFGPGDMGEVYAISLAEVLGLHSLITDDTKQGGPYMSLLQFEDEDNEIMPFTYTDVLLLNYLEGLADEKGTIAAFNKINQITDMNWSFRSQTEKFIRRFWKAPYQEREKQWMTGFCNAHGVSAKEKMKALSRYL